MQSTHPLQTFLQLHLASDASAVSNLQYVTSSLTTELLVPSPHLGKWAARIQSLLRAKDSGPRWAGLCLALQTARLSRDYLLENSQSWCAYALPLLLKEPNPAVTKALIRLLTMVFLSQPGAELTRQLVTPNVPKFTNCLTELGKRSQDFSMKQFLLDSITSLVSAFPNLHRPLYQALQNFALELMDANARSVVLPSSRIVDCAADLLAVLPNTSGKVKSAELWRKSVDDALGFCWTAVRSVRSTYTTRTKSRLNDRGVSESNPDVWLSLHQLDCGAKRVVSLLRVVSLRPIPIPLASIMELVMALLDTSVDDEVNDQTDPIMHSMERLVVPRLHEISCNLLCTVVNCLQKHISPYLMAILQRIAYRLEQSSQIAQKLPFARVIFLLISLFPNIHNAYLPGRLVKALLPSLASILSAGSIVHSPQSITGEKRKGKKRARPYEVDEIFSSEKSSLSLSPADVEVITLSLKTLPLILRRSKIPTSMRYVALKLLISLSMLLPRISPSCISADPNFHLQILLGVQSSCAMLVSDTHTMNRSLLPLAIAARSQSQYGISDDQSVVELMLHPRLPPQLLSQPKLQDVLLSSTPPDESNEVLQQLGLSSSSSENVSRTENGGVYNVDLTISAKSGTAISTGDQMDITFENPTVQQLVGFQSSIIQHEQNTFSGHTKRISTDEAKQLAEIQPPVVVESHSSAPTWPNDPSSNLSNPLQNAKQLEDNRMAAGMQITQVSQSRVSGPLSDDDEDDDDDEDIPQINMDSDSD